MDVKAMVRSTKREKREKLGVGDYCKAKNKQGLWLRGRILDKRRLPSSQNGERIDSEYFVHFEGQDWKFDEWVTADGLQPAEGVDLNLDLEWEDDGAGGKRRSARLSSGSTRDETGNEPDAAESRETIAELKHKVRYVETVKVGKYEIETWYAAPFHQKKDVRFLYFCEYCLLFTSNLDAYKHHWHVCPAYGPPGKEIYRKGEVSIREVDGAKFTTYCQCLCLLGKAFIDHKDLVFSAEAFMFYVLCEMDERGEHLVGYFSKEKEITDASINLNCIMILPPYHGKGYGKLLIDLSYTMSRIMGQPGSPEKPISDLGKFSYTSYWRWAVLSHLKDMDEQNIRINLGRLVKLTGICEEDVFQVLCELGFVKESKTGEKTIVFPKKLIQESIDKYNVKRPKVYIHTDYLAWVPPKPENPKPL